METLTTEQMRKKIFEARFDNSLIRNVMDTADYSGMSSEDRYTLLSYYLLQQNIEIQKHLLETLRTMPLPNFIKNGG